MEVKRPILVILLITTSVVLARDYTWGYRLPGDYRIIEHPIKVPESSLKQTTGTKGTFIVRGNAFVNYLNLIDNTNENSCTVSMVSHSPKNFTIFFEDSKGNLIDYKAEIYVKNYKV